MHVKHVFQFQSISKKLMVIMGTIVVLSLILVNLVAFSKLESNIMSDKREMTRKLVQANVSVLQHYYDQMKDGRLSEPEAKKMAVQAVEHSLYGPGHKDYFWIHDEQHVMVMHPYKPQLNGQDVSGVKDKQGNLLFQDMVDEVKESGAGYVTYYWQYYGQEDRVEPKLSYVAGFEPWEWIVGTGVYINDVRERVASARNNLLALEGLVLVFILSVTIAVARFMTGPIRRLQVSANQVAQGKLETDIPVTTSDEVGSLAQSIQHMVGQLKTMIRQADDKTAEAMDKTAQAEAAREEAEEAMRRAELAREEGMREAAQGLNEIVERLSAASEEISAQIEEVSQGADGQKSRTNEVATAIEEMNASVLEISRNASQAAEGAEETRLKAGEGNEVMAKVAASMKSVHSRAHELAGSLNDLGQHVQEINKVMEMINDIADQTNLLALNAAIEAARAGEAGHGFAVVADEVRKLAEKTMQATQEVGQTIASIQNKTSRNVTDMNEANGVVQETLGLATQAEDSLKAIVTVAQSNYEQVRNIATASEEQSAACEEINQSTEDVSRTATQTSEVMSQSSQAVRELTRLTSDLSRIISEMRQGDQGNLHGSALERTPEG